MEKVLITVLDKDGRYFNDSTVGKTYEGFTLLKGERIPDEFSYYFGQTTREDSVNFIDDAGDTVAFWQSQKDVLACVKVEKV